MGRGVDRQERDGDRREQQAARRAFRAPVEEQPAPPDNAGDGEAPGRGPAITTSGEAIEAPIRPRMFRAGSSVADSQLGSSGE
jgi:hypothetical protein